MKRESMKWYWASVAVAGAVTIFVAFLLFVPTLLHSWPPLPLWIVFGVCGTYAYLGGVKFTALSGAGTFLSWVWPLAWFVGFLVWTVSDEP